MLEEVVFETPPVEEPSQPTDITSVIFSAMNSHHKLSIMYLKKSTGETTERIVEPYSFRKDENGLVYFYLFDESHPTAQIKSFIFSNITNAVELQDTFSPKVTVEPLSIFDPPPIGTSAPVEVKPEPTPEVKPTTIEPTPPIQAEPQAPKTGQFVVFEEEVG